MRTGGSLSEFVNEENKPKFQSTYRSFLNTWDANCLAVVIASNDDLPRSPFERGNITIVYSFLTSVDVEGDAVVESLNPSSKS